MTHNLPSEISVKPDQDKVTQDSACAKSTAGKILHNELTYRVVDLGLNSTVGVTSAFITERTEFGREKIQKPIMNFFRTILKPILREHELIEQGAKRGNNFVSIIFGGAAIIPLIVALDKKENKKAIIRGIDEMIYGQDKVASDPRFQACYNAVDKEPKKDFWTGMAARFAVLLPQLAVTVHPEVDTILVKYLYNPISGMSRKAAKYLDIQPKSLMQKGTMEYINGDVTKCKEFVSDWDFIHKTIGFDFGLTAIYCFAHEYTYKAFAKMFGKKPDETAIVEPLESRPETTVPQFELAETHRHNWAEKQHPQAAEFAERNYHLEQHMGVA